MVGAYGQGVSPFFALFGLPFVLIGTYLAIARYVHDAWARRKTLYGITRDQIVIRSGIVRPQLHVFDLGSLTNLNMVEHGTQGEGTIYFGRPPVEAAKFKISFGREGSGHNTNVIGPDGEGPAFDHIADARTVYVLLRDALEKAQQK
jgi:hypothetical protein